MQSKSKFDLNKFSSNQSISELRRDVEQAGWRIQSWQDCRPPSIPTLVHWQNNLDRVFGYRIPPDHLSMLGKLKPEAFKSLENYWCQAFPLIDIVAD